MQMIEDAPGDIASMCSSLEILSELLRKIQSTGTPAHQTTLLSALDDCDKVVEATQRLFGELSQGFASKGSFKQKWAALKAVQKEPRIKKLRGKLQQAQLTLQLAHQQASR